MKILGIETSCDDTGIAVLEIDQGARAYRGRMSRFSLLANVVTSQVAVHQEYGGVFPSLAKREHQKNLPVVLAKALQETGVEKADVVAVTHGPGLSPCLWAGLHFAKELAKKWNVPLVPVDHIEGHLLVALLDDKKSQPPIRQLTDKSQTNSKYQILNTKYFPAVALIVSGGHTQLVFVKDIGRYEIIGETRDDAAGECFDKTARLLGLGYPGGPAIAREASAFAQATADKAKFNISLPRPMIRTKNYDFSFSGLKTAALYDYQKRPEKIRKSKQYIQAMAAEIQQAIVNVLVAKTIRAAQEHRVKSVILGGGVAANESLRHHLKHMAGAKNIKLLAPPANLATDNGAMVALAGYFTYAQGAYPKNLDAIEARPNLRIA